MPRGRSTFNKRQKEQARQQHQRDKAERRKQRGQEEKPETTPDDEMALLRQHAEAQAALFHVDPAGSHRQDLSESDHTGTGPKHSDD